jgi:hypothetical protein
MSKKLKVLGVVLIALCAFGAISASAQGAHKFTVEGVSSGNEPIASAVAITPTGGVLTLTVPNLLWITCSSMTVNGGSITVNSDQGSATSFSFGGCSVDNTSGAAAAGCTVKSFGGAAGTITTGGLTATLIEVTGAGYVTFKPTGSSITDVVVEGVTCLFANRYPVTGTFAMKVSSPVAGVLATTVELESSQVIQERSGDAVLFGTRFAYLDGRFDLTLGSDRRWGFDL